MADTQTDYQHEDYPDLEARPRRRRQVSRLRWIVGGLVATGIVLYGSYDVRMLAFMDGQKAGMAHGICLGKTEDQVTCQRYFPLKAYKPLW